MNQDQQIQKMQKELMKSEKEKADLQQQLNDALLSELKARRYMDDLVDVLKSALLQERAQRARDS